MLAMIKALIQAVASAAGQRPNDLLSLTASI
jgi:hypothetical protein